MSLSMSPKGEVIKTVQLTQRNSKATQKRAGRDPINLTQRSFKMEDILNDTTSDASKQRNRLKHNPDALDAKKFKPLNMKEIQLQHSARKHQKDSLYRRKSLTSK